MLGSHLNKNRRRLYLSVDLIQSENTFGKLVCGVIDGPLATRKNEI